MGYKVGKQTVVVASDFLLLRKGRTEIYVNVTGPSNEPALPALEQRIAKTLLAASAPDRPPPGRVSWPRVRVPGAVSLLWAPSPRKTCCPAGKPPVAPESAGPSGDRQ